jgi:hypothetical protein
MLFVHNVYFTLNDPSAAAKQKLVDACKKYLTDHPGMTFFAVGTLAEEYARPVNDRDFHVSLHMAFDSRKTHDAYQVAARHNTFIEENKADWKQVRVFDSDASS